MRWKLLLQLAKVLELLNAIFERYVVLSAKKMDKLLKQQLNMCLFSLDRLLK